MRVGNGVLAAAIAGLAISVSIKVLAQPPATQAPATQAPATEAQPTQTPAKPPQPAQAVQTPSQGEHGGQAPAATTPQGAADRRRRPRFPAHQRPPADPAIVARGKALYAGACAACHGADARGGQLGGVNLLRSQLVLNDKDGELIQPVVQNGRPGTQMPPIPMSADDIKAVATFLHDLQAKGSNQGGPPPGETVPLNVLVGDAKAGAELFAARCASCHSPTGDLRGIGTRISDAKTLQNLWVSGGVAGTGEAGSEDSDRAVVTATITMPSGEQVEGELVRIDDFLITIARADGHQRTFRRSGDVPKIAISDPLDAHRALLAVYTNKNMHDVTAYLASLK
ncbi:MAG: c-type cytochrome [Luteitalea sp.]|nr:c-type cytochrome [Luteitalea sp.]